MRKMKHRILTLSTCAAVFVAGTSDAAEPVRVHLAGGAAHAVGPPQEREFGAGGGGSAALELPVTGALGVQASAGGVVLAKGDPPSDPGLAPTSTGSAFLGTVGVRLRLFGSSRVAGPWIDVNGGLAQTGSLSRPTVDSHIGWDFRLPGAGSWDVGPFVGYTQIVQPDSELRSHDARIAWAGIQVSIGAREKPRSAPRPPAEPTLRDRDGQIEAFDVCPKNFLEGPPECRPEPPPAIEIVREDDQERIRMRDMIHFEYDRARIRTDSYWIVKDLADFIQRHPDILEVSIEGHADAVGTEEYNQQLSEARAESTRALLVRFGADADRLVVVGHGKSQLRVVTPKPDGRNRRVEFYVTRRRASQEAKSGSPSGPRGRQ